MDGDANNVHGLAIESFPTVLLFPALADADRAPLRYGGNEWTAEGWNFDTMQFAMRESSKRPAMAFLVFTRDEEAAV